MELVGTQQKEDEKTNKKPGCRHHWVISSPRGLSSIGVCKICGKRRRFYNSGRPMSCHEVLHRKAQAALRLRKAVTA